MPKGKKPTPKVDGKKEIDRMLKDIRHAVSQCKAPEVDCYDALDTEAEGWRERLSELKGEQADDSKPAEGNPPGTNA